MQPNRMTAKQAGYMELSGAQKDADCRKVEVAGGISTELGCCNEFEPENKQVQQFRCGNCEYLRPKQSLGERLASARTKLS